MNSRALLIVLLLTLVPESAPATAEAPTVPELISAHLAETPATGIAVGLFRDGTERLFVEGLRTRGGRGRIDEGTVFDLGTATQVVTGLVFADLVVRGEVAPDETVAGCLPGSVRVPGTDEEPMRLHHLATHTSGLPAEVPVLVRGSISENVESALASCTLVGAVGAQRSPSDFGVGLLGHLLARKTGRDFESLVADRIAGPMGLASFTCDVDKDPRANRARGHDGEGFGVAQWAGKTVLPGKSSLRTNVRDALTFLRAHLRPGGRDGIDRALRLATGRASANDVPFVWRQEGNANSRRLTKAGSSPGFRCFLGLDLAGGAAVVVLSNGEVPVDALGRKILAVQPLPTSSAPEKR